MHQKSRRERELSKEDISRGLQTHRQMPPFVPGVCVDCIFWDSEFANLFEQCDFLEDVTLTAPCRRYPKPTGMVCQDEWCGEFSVLPSDEVRKARGAELIECVRRYAAQYGLKVTDA